MSRPTHPRADTDHHSTTLDSVVELSADVLTASAGDPLTDGLAAIEAGASGDPNPMTTQDDLVIGGVSGALARLAKGAANEILKIASGHLDWAPSSALVSPMTTLGDLIRGGASGVETRLGIGANGRRLLVVSGLPSWQAPAPAGMTNPMTTLGDMIFENDTPTADRLPIGTDGQRLHVHQVGLTKTPQWEDIPTVAVDDGGVGGSPGVTVSEIELLSFNPGHVVELGTGVGGGAAVWVPRRDLTPGDGPYGTGSDGDCVVTANGTFDFGPITNNRLSRDAFFHNLVLPLGMLLDLGGMRLYVSGTLVLMDPGEYQLNVNGDFGNAGGNGGATSGGGGGSGGTARQSGEIGLSQGGQTGGAGGLQGNAAGSPGNAAVGGAWDSTKTSGAGGTGGASGGAGGAGGAAAAWTDSLQVRPWIYPLCVSFHTYDDAAFSVGNIVGRAASGGGGGGTTSGRGGGGGGGGGCAGVGIIVARRIAGAGGIAAAGGSGGNGGTGFAGAGGGGGGSGGNGGVIVLVYGDDTYFTGAFNTNGGNHGTGVGGGTNGSNGADGQAIKVRFG